MNKYEIALDEIASRYFLVSDSIHGTSHEKDMEYFNTLHEAVSRVTAMDDGIDPYVSLLDCKKNRNAFVRLNRCEPYFFEDLREGMYVYDKKLRRIVMIEGITEGQNIIFTVISNEHQLDKICCCRYEDGVFFPVHALYVFEGEILHTPESKPEYPDYLWDKSKR